MPSVSIIRSDNPNGPADEMGLRYEVQHERKDSEAMILNEFEKITSNAQPPDVLEDLIIEYCEKLGGITIQQFIHKLEIFYGRIEDDERKWRKQKYGKQ